MTGYEGAKNRFAVRSIAVVAVIGSMFAATLIALAFITPKSTASWVVVGLIPVEWALMVGLMTSIAMFNRPSCLIPPMMRDRM